MNSTTFKVLYDLRLNIEDVTGFLIDRGPDNKALPKVSPGTPRHPAYPSGHSTYSAAASHVLGCFFPDSRTEFDKLANNIGWARLWGGVHWERDHTFGQQVGAAVGRLIIAQLDATGIGAMSEAPVERPSPDSVRDDARDFHQECESAKSDFCKGVWKADAPAQIQNTI